MVTVHYLLYLHNRHKHILSHLTNVYDHYGNFSDKDSLITQVAATDDDEDSCFSTYVLPKRPISQKVLEVTGSTFYSSSLQPT